MKKSSKNHFSVPPSGVRGLISGARGLFFLLFFSFFSQAQIVNIPNADFKARLLAASPNSGIASTQTPVYNSTTDTWSVSTYHKIDTNNDGEIQVSEALAIKYLNVSNSPSISVFISNLTGIEAFTNLNSLLCEENNLTSLNLSSLVNLINLNCNQNQLANINLSGLINLQKIECNNNGLSTINLSTLTNLKKINCSLNFLTSINTSGINNLEVLDCSYNQLPSLNVSSLTNLQKLNCGANLLPSLNVSGLINLKELNCGGNQLPSLNFNGLINLKELNCVYNQLPSLNVSGLTNLEKFYCNNNLLPSLNVSGLINLKELSCGNNQLPSLNVLGLNNLEKLHCNNNQLPSINITGLTSLKELYCGGNQLPSLNVTSLTNLKILHCNNNQLPSLNVSGLTNLYELNFSSNQLTTINLNNLNLLDLNCSNNQLLSIFMKFDLSIIHNGGGGAAPPPEYGFSNNPNLQYICTNEQMIPLIQAELNSLGYTSCNVNTYCSFTPGGTFYTIQGNNKYDSNNNGCDSNDPILPNLKFNITNGSINGNFISNTSGNYFIPVGTGTHTITPQLENPSLFITTPANAQVTFANSNNNTQTQNFCVTPNPANITCSYESVIMPISPVRPGFNCDFKIIYRNLGNVVLTGEVVLPYNANTMTYISATPAPTTISNGLLKWSFNQMLPLQNRQITIKFNINPPTHPTFPVNGGDLVCFEPYMSITNNCGSVNQPEFDETCFTVVNAYDPNDKTCLQGNTPSPQYIGKYVHYKIRFENTGTFFAQNVVVRDDIDLTKFDINSLVVLDASHNMLVTRIKDNRVEFIFENIQLPFPPSEARHGYILFKIKLKSNLVVGNTFSNRANIYFDYNFPIITNNEVSTLTALGTPDFEFSEFITLFPNPAKDKISIHTKQDINLKSIEIFNMLGQLVMAIPNQANQTNIDISQLTSGQYMVKVNTDKGSSSTKLMVND